MCKQIFQIPLEKYKITHMLIIAHSYLAPTSYFFNAVNSCVAITSTFFQDVLEFRPAFFPFKQVDKFLIILVLIMFCSVCTVILKNNF